MKFLKWVAGTVMTVFAALVSLLLVVTWLLPERPERSLDDLRRDVREMEHDLERRSGARVGQLERTIREIDALLADPGDPRAGARIRELRDRFERLLETLHAERESFARQLREARGHGAARAGETPGVTAAAPAQARTSRGDR